MNCYVTKAFARDLVNHNYQFGLSSARQSGTYICNNKCGSRIPWVLNAPINGRELLCERALGNLRDTYVGYRRKP